MNSVTTPDSEPTWLAPFALSLAIIIGLSVTAPLITTGLLTPLLWFFPSTMLLWVAMVGVPSMRRMAGWPCKPVNFLAAFWAFQLIIAAIITLQTRLFGV